MKRIQDDLDIRGAFSPVPEDVKNMLVRTANSVKEEETVRKYRWGAVLLAAMIIVATMSVAVAASELIGWTDFFSRLYDRTLPTEAQEILAQTKQQSFQVGPLTLTTQELLCDGENAFTSIIAHTTDGSPAILCAYGEWNEAVYANRADTEEQRLGVNGKMSWVQAAKELGLPLYAVRAIPEVEFKLMNGEQAEESLHDAEGALVYFSMVPLRADKVGDTLSLNYYLHVAEIDVETGLVGKGWEERVAGEIPVTSSVLAEKTYHPATEGPVYGYELESVLIEMRVTGGYVTMNFTAPEGATEEEYWDDVWPYLVDAVTLCDADGEPFKDGIGLSISADLSNWPTVAVRETLNISELPETIKVITNEVERTEPQSFEVVFPAN